ncbi:MAG: SufE family protein [Flavobacteriales bacterium]|jgi:cysteine desulfuration protein SufE|tara:strand:- start:144 stop:575 length:432 start_codon:yes stop_codon:yes gene_type:complete
MQVIDLEKEIISEFEMFDNWMEKYEYLIELGKDLPLISSNHKNDENIIKGCQSKVWLHAEYENDLVSFYADSEAIITKGIIALLIRVLNNQTPKNILEAKLNFINEIGLTNHLSPTRANGLVEMVKQIKAYAYSLRIKNNLNN